MDTVTPADTCPLCGGPNDCAVARGEEQCWCFDVVFPPNLLDRMPEADQGKVCVCGKCIKEAQRDLSN